jgi:Family of unknown function (DUF6130)
MIRLVAHAPCGKHVLTLSRARMCLPSALDDSRLTSTLRHAKGENAMTKLIKALAAVAAGTVLITSAFAQGALELRGTSPLVAIENEPAPKLIVDPPLPGPLARGAVLIPYRVVNLRILPVLGTGARNVSPRVGHLHVTVDDLPWRWGDFSNTNTIVVVGLPPGQHKVLIELADPEHHVLTGQAVTFTVPSPAR